MRRPFLLSALSLAASIRVASCVRAPTAHADAGPPRPAPAAPAAPALEAVGARSGCAFASREALCEGFREHFRSSGEGWVSDGCAFGAPRASGGAFAEVLLVGVRNGYGRPTGAGTVERPLLGGTVRAPAGEDAGTPQILLAARVGGAWFPVHIFRVRESDASGAQLAWSLEQAGAYLSWSDREGNPEPDAPDGYGARTREIAVVDRGVPMLAASATVARWRSEVDLACARACNRAPNPPPSPECSRRCASSLRETRSWERVGSTLRIGATVVERRGPAAGTLEARPEPALTRRLDAPDGWLGFCAFVPVVRAVAPPALPTHAAAVAARARAQAVLRNGAFRELPGAAAAVARGAAVARLEIYGTQGTACGGGGCTTSVQYRTLEGTMPERGVAYFANERGNQAGCDAATLPRGAGSTYVEVAPTASRAAAGCGFSGYDGTARRYWIVTRVFVPRR